MINFINKKIKENTIKESKKVLKKNYIHIEKRSFKLFWRKDKKSKIVWQKLRKKTPVISFIHSHLTSIPINNPFNKFIKMPSKFWVMKI